METRKKPHGNSKAPKFIEAMERVLNYPHSVGYAIIFTDEDLVEMINEELDEADQISMRAFRMWKAGEAIDDERLEVFVACYKKAVRDQQENLFAALRSDVPGGWQRYAWILERKFPNWNLTAKQEVRMPDLGRLVLKTKLPQNGSGE